MAPDNEQETHDDSPLSMSEAIAAYAATDDAPKPDEEADTGQPEAEEAADPDPTADEADPADEAGDDDGEPGDDDQAEADDGDDGEQESDGGRFVSDNAKVRLADGTVVSIADLKSGSLMHADYTRKTQEIAEQRRSVETQSSALQQQEQQLSEQREYISNLLQSIMPQEPDPALATTDPFAYTTQKANYEAFMRHHAYLQQQAEGTRQQQEQEAAAQRVEKGNAEMAALVEKVPGLKDPNRFSGFVNDIREHGTQYGFSARELAEGVGFDHRMALVMRDAIQWRKLQASRTKAPTKQGQRPPVQKGGKRFTPAEGKAREANAAMDRLNTSGKLADGVAALIALEGKG